MANFSNIHWNRANNLSNMEHYSGGAVQHDGITISQSKTSEWDEQIPGRFKQSMRQEEIELG